MSTPWFGFAGIAALFAFIVLVVLSMMSRPGKALQAATSEPNLMSGRLGEWFTFSAATATVVGMFLFWLVAAVVLQDVRSTPNGFGIVFLCAAGFGLSSVPTVLYFVSLFRGLAAVGRASSARKPAR